MTATQPVASRWETLEARMQHQAPGALSSHADRKAQYLMTSDKWLNIVLVLAMLFALAIWARTMIKMTAEIIGLMNIR